MHTSLRWTRRILTPISEDDESALREIDLSDMALNGPELEGIYSKASCVLQLNLSFNRLHSMATFNCFTSLRKLNISHNSITTLEFSSQLCNLQFLDCSYNQLSNLGSINQLPELKVVWANDNVIADFSMVSEMRSLMWLVLFNNPCASSALSMILPNGKVIVSPTYGEHTEFKINQDNKTSLIDQTIESVLERSDGLASVPANNVSVIMSPTGEYTKSKLHQDNNSSSSIGQTIESVLENSDDSMSVLTNNAPETESIENQSSVSDKSPEREDSTKGVRVSNNQVEYKKEIQPQKTNNEITGKNDHLNENEICSKEVYSKGNKNAVLFRNDGSWEVRWPSGSIAISIENLENGQRVLIMNENGGVLASFDNKGSGTLNYENGKTFLSVSNSGRGIVMDEKNAVDEVFYCDDDSQGRKYWKHSLGSCLMFEVTIEVREIPIIKAFFKCQDVFYSFTTGAEGIQIARLDVQDTDMMMPISKQNRRKKSLKPKIPELHRILPTMQSIISDLENIEILRKN